MRLSGPHFHFVLVEKNFTTQVICKIIFNLHVETSHDDLLYCAVHYAAKKQMKVLMNNNCEL
jgi:hypothetical protein